MVFTLFGNVPPHHIKNMLGEDNSGSNVLQGLIEATVVREYQICPYTHEFDMSGLCGSTGAYFYGNAIMNTRGKMIIILTWRGFEQCIRSNSPLNRRRGL